MNARDIEGWMQEEELLWLSETAARMGSIVEIGSWKGRSTYAMATHTKGKVICIDHFKGSPGERDTNHAEAKQGNIYEQFFKHIGHLENVSILKMDSIEASHLFASNSVDMVFIDGDHSELGALADILAWKRVARKLLCGHDGNMEEIEKALKRAKIDYRMIEGTTLWAEKNR